ncbi:MAG: glycosyltransferase family 2 protein [Candidatus Shapirobacteria bacterium]|nr:glycosyltransferase family 2 protein [Candidatus Shapirobacteria bacterium]
MISIALIVLNWKQPKLTLDTIDSILKIKTDSFKYKIFLVDNASPDNSIDIFQKKYSQNKQIEIIQTGANLGYVGNNIGIKKALKEKFDYILLINNDVLVDPFFLQELVSETKNGYDLLGPKIYFAPHFEYHKDRYSKEEIGKVIWSAGGQMDWDNVYGSNIGVDEVDRGQRDQITTNLDFLTGCCLLVNSKVFKKIGLLDEKFFMYLEDVDFCQRAKQFGFKLAYIPKSKIWHVNSGSSKSGGDLHDYFITRNRLLFGFKYAKLKTKFALLRESFRFLLNPSTSSWKKKAVIDFYFKKLGKGSWK